MSEKSYKTTIQILASTRELLANHALRKETYEETLLRLMKFWDKHNPSKKGENGE